MGVWGHAWLAGSKPQRMQGNRGLPGRQTGARHLAGGRLCTTHPPARPFAHLDVCGSVWVLQERRLPHCQGGAVLLGAVGKVVWLEDVIGGAAARAGRQARGRQAGQAGRSGVQIIGGSARQRLPAAAGRHATPPPNRVHIARQAGSAGRQDRLAGRMSWQAGRQQPGALTR